MFTEKDKNPKEESKEQALPLPEVKFGTVRKVYQAKQKKEVPN